jgi:hypothetical protein
LSGKGVFLELVTDSLYLIHVDRMAYIAASTIPNPLAVGPMKIRLAFISKLPHVRVEEGYPLHISVTRENPYNLSQSEEDVEPPARNLHKAGARCLILKNHRHCHLDASPITNCDLPTMGNQISEQFLVERT